LSGVDAPFHKDGSAATSGGFSAGRRTIAGGKQSQRTTASAIPGWKRVLDVLCIVLSLPFVVPLVAVIALWIRLVSRGPALFRQVRIGWGGKQFVLYKFRSMKMDCGTSSHEAYLRNLVASNSPMIKLDLICDSRVIPGGCLLRSAGLDELPQLLNVLRGEMSLVGPRPCLPEEYRFFSAKQRARFMVLPGLTGIWQVNGKNQTTFREMNLMDVYYANHASPALDIGIMMRTPSALLLQMCQASQQKKARSQRARFEPSAGNPRQAAFPNGPAR
jgi:lipopolysaccharide/colanic/teichoic acid biosynthesis glycosyltransferase